MSDKKIIRLNPTPKDFGKVADELTSDMFESALPVQHSHSYYENDKLGLYIGVWDTTEMLKNAAPYACDEFMLLLEGQASIRNNKTGEFTTVKSGEAFVIPKGYDCQWQQNGYLRKFYVISEHPEQVIPEKPNYSDIINISEALRSTSESISLTSSIKVKETGDSFIIKSGKPVPKGQCLYQDHRGHFSSGIWQSGSFETAQQAFPCHEFLYIQSGQLECIDQHNQAHKFSQGDALFIPQGTICHWRVDDSVCTFYVVIQPEDPT